MLVLWSWRDLHRPVRAGRFGSLNKPEITLLPIPHQSRDGTCVGALLNELFQSDPVNGHVIRFLSLRVGEPEQTVSRTMTAFQGLWTRSTCPAALPAGRPSGLPPRNAAAPPPTPRPGTRPPPCAPSTCALHCMPLSYRWPCSACRCCCSSLASARHEASMLRPMSGSAPRARGSSRQFHHAVPSGWHVGVERLAIGTALVFSCNCPIERHDALVKPAEKRV